MKTVTFSAQLKSAGIAAWIKGKAYEPQIMVELFDGTKLAVESVSFDGYNIIIKPGDGDG
jgi:hypothetical protein